MKEKTKNLIIALFFVFLQVLIILRNYFSGYFILYWYCDLAPSIYAIFFFFKSKDAIKGYINIGLIPQLIFLFAYFYKLVFDVSLLGDVTASLSNDLFYTLSTTIGHLASLIAFLFVMGSKPSKKSLFYSFIFLVLIYLITLIFTSPNDYINYVYSSGNLVLFKIPYLTYIWVPLTFVLLVIPTQLIQYLVYWLINRRRVNN